MASSQASAGQDRAGGMQDPEFAKNAGDLAGLAVYLGLGHLRRRPGRVNRVVRSMAVRGQVREALMPKKKSGGHGRLVVALGATAGLAYARSARRKHRETVGPPAQPVDDTVAREPSLSGSR